MKSIDESDKGKSGIYKITNIANNKVYIGQSINLWTRIKEGYIQKLPKNKGHNVHLQRSWNKHGSENFKFEVLEHITDYHKLNSQETYWIKFYRACDNEYGFNMLSEGGSTRGSVCSDERKIKQSIAVSGEKNGMYGKTHTDEVKKKLSKARSIPIIQLHIDGTYIKQWNSITEASEYYNIARAPITAVLRKKTTTSCGFVWVYKYEYDSCEFDINVHMNKRISLKKPVVQLSLENKFINEFVSIREAIRETNARNITIACQGKMKTAGGFKWMYKEEYDSIKI